MAIYQSDTQLYEVLGDVFERVAQNPDHIESFTKSNLVIRMRFHEPQAEILLDGRQPPLGVFFGPRPGRADLELEMPADLLHQIWMNEEKLRDAFFGGRIKSKGNIFRVMKLADLFREAERVYPDIVKRYNLL
jgi:hypothetical protein